MSKVRRKSPPKVVAPRRAPGRVDSRGAQEEGLRVKELLEQGYAWAKFHRRAIERLYIRGMRLGWERPVIASLPMEHPKIRELLEEFPGWREVGVECSHGVEFLAYPWEVAMRITRGHEQGLSFSAEEIAPDGKFLVFGSNGQRSYVLWLEEP